MKKAVLLFFFAWTSHLTASAQLTDREYRNAYKHAVQLFANQQFSDAVKELMPLTSSQYRNPIVPFAHYYLALSSNNLKNFGQSRLSLRQLLERFPNWKHLDEAHYLYAESYFGDKYYEQAFYQLNRIQNPALQTDMDNMAAKYVYQITDLAMLKELNEKFPSERTIAVALIDAIQKKKNPTRDELRLSDLLTNRYELGQKPPSREFRNDSNTNSIDIGLLLPFDVGNYTPDMRASNQYVYDMYIGMKMGMEKLREDGLNANLFAFDVGKDADDFNRLTTDRSLAAIDLFVGPMFVQANPAVLEYTYRNKIFQVHPLSNNSDLVKDEGVFLINPSYRDYANQALDDAEAQKLRKSVNIYYGKSRRDSLAAFHYAEIAENRGFQVGQLTKISSATSLSGSASGHIYLSCDPEESNGLLGAIRKQRPTIPVYMAGASIHLDKTSKDLLRNNVFLLYPQYINNEKVEVSNFRAKYITDYGIVPSYYSFLGYDMALLFGKMLRDGKSNFRSNLNLIEYTDGFLLSGYDYTNNSNTNRLIPIVQYTSDGLREIIR